MAAPEQVAESLLLSFGKGDDSLVLLQVLLQVSEAK